MRIIIHISILSLLLLIMGCGAQQADTLETKKLRLAELRKNSLSINQQITELEAEISKLDINQIKKNKVIKVAIEDLQLQKFEHYIEVQGIISANKNVLVSSQTPGAITRINVREGQVVGTGAILAEIDDVVMRSSIDELKTSLDLANILYEKQERLWKKEIGTEVQYLTAKNQKESLERKLKTLESQLDKYKIRAPFRGVVDQVIAKQGELLNPGMPAFRVVNSTDLSLKAKVSEAYSPFIKRGDSVRLEFPTLQKSVKAKISAVGQAINPQDRTFSVDVKLADDPQFKANMYGNISINDRTIDKAIVVPISIIQKSEQGEFIFVAQEENGKWYAKRRFIEQGLSYGGNVVVDGGLEVNEKLITAGDVNDGVEISWENQTN